MDPSTVVSIWYVTGDDDLDDPALGMAPVWVGSARDAVAWLKANGCERYSVSERGKMAIWAANFLNMVDVPDTRALAIRRILEEQLTFAATYQTTFDIDEAVRRIVEVVDEPMPPSESSQT